MPPASGAVYVTEFPVPEMDPPTVVQVTPAFVLLVTVAVKVVVPPTFNVVVGGVMLTLVALKPLPESETECGLPGALSAIRRVAVRVPAVVGLNITLKLALPLAGTVRDDAVEVAKSPGLAPLKDSPEIVRSAVPVFETVITDGALEVPTVWLSNVTLDCATAKIGPGNAPVPVSAMVC